MIRSGVLLSFYSISLILQDSKNSMGLLDSVCRWSSRKEDTSRCRCQNKADCEDCTTTACACLSGCLPGYQGPACQHLCPRGWYGVNCSRQCGQCRSDHCHPVTGTCPTGCLPHWTGTLCHIDCKNNTKLCRVCSDCLSGPKPCDNVTGVCRVEGCPDPDQRHLCQANTTCQSQPCSCGACMGGNSDCDISTGVCLNGCRPGFTGKSCTEPCGNSKLGPHCRHTCDQCPCGCLRVRSTCLSCNADSRDNPQKTKVVSSQTRAEYGISQWVVILTTLVGAIVLIGIAIKIAISTSQSTRTTYVKEIFDKLMADKAFCIIDSNQEDETNQTEERPKLDMSTLSVQDSKTVLKELNNLLGQNESFAHFRQSVRYKEFRLTVANKLWATENQTRQGRDRSNSITDALMIRAKQHLKIKMGVPKENMTESKLTDECFVPSSILKEGGNQSAEIVMTDNKPGLSVRFSSATSLVIFPSSSASSTSGFVPAMPEAKSV